ncbi:MAG TPA: 30S ribosomal protein S3 [Actinobacteria bacterium]|nr:30S ribosomal protein S3 [Actinomycetota bacterium]
MGQKVNPIGLRIGINKGWQSRWFATRDYARLLKEDMMIRQIIEDQLENAGISKIEMERTAEEIKVDMHTSKPGMVIGRRGATINDIRKSIEDATGNIIQLNIVEVKKPELVAKLVAENIANQLLGRVSFRRAMKKAMTLSLKAGAKGIKIQCSGRLGGAEMARTEWYREGRVPLHTLRANIDYGFAEANTTFGKIGVKAWLYLGDVILDDNTANEKPAVERPSLSPGSRAKDAVKDSVKKGARKIREIRKTVISSGLGTSEDSESSEKKVENKELKKTVKPVTMEKAESKEKEAKGTKRSESKKVEAKGTKGSESKKVEAKDNKGTGKDNIKKTDKKEDKKDS